MTKHTLKLFCVTALITEKKLCKKFVKLGWSSFAKRNQGKQAFLGILAFLLGSQYDVHFFADIKSLKNEKKKKLPYEQAVDLRFSYLQKGISSPRSIFKIWYSLWNFRSKQQDS